MQSVAHLEAFLIKKGMLFLHVSNILGLCRGDRTPDMPKPGKWVDLNTS